MAIENTIVNHNYHYTMYLTFFPHFNDLSSTDTSDLRREGVSDACCN